MWPFPSLSTYLCREVGEDEAFEGEDEADVLARQAVLESGFRYCTCSRPKASSRMIVCKSGRGGCNGYAMPCTCRACVNVTT